MVTIKGLEWASTTLFVQKNLWISNNNWRRLLSLMFKTGIEKKKTKVSWNIRNETSSKYIHKKI